MNTVPEISRGVTPNSGRKDIPFTKTYAVMRLELQITGVKEEQFF